MSDKKIEDLTVPELLELAIEAFDRDYVFKEAPDYVMSTLVRCEINIARNQILRLQEIAKENGGLTHHGMRKLMERIDAADKK